MALPVRDQMKYWGIAAAVFSVVLWFLGDVLLPFILGGAIAYCLDPVADALERAGLKRGAATAVITVVALILFVIMTLAVIPLLIQQAIALFEFAPQLFRDLQAFLTERFPNMMDEGSVVQSTLIDLGDAIKQRGGQLIQAALASVGSLLNLVTLLLITPVVAVYLLMDWDRMVGRVDEMLPLDHKPVIRRLAAEVDRVLAGFIRGMGSVCLILGTYYALALWAVGLQFGPVVGVIAGALTFIPYVGRGAGDLPVLGRMVVDPGGLRHLPVRPVRRGQYPDAEPGGQLGRSASGLAAPGAVGLRHAVRVCRPAGGGAAGGGPGGADPLCDPAVQGLSPVPGHLRGQQLFRKRR